MLSRSPGLCYAWPVIYLDANATTPTAPAVVAAMLPWLHEHYANPSASYTSGRRARRAIETARAQVAALIHAETAEIVFTSGGTESINSIHAFARNEWPQRPHLVISTTEHSAVIECAALWQQQGGIVTQVPVDTNGLLNLDALRTAIIPGQTALVSLLWANNETGVIAPMRQAIEIAHAAGALVHADAVQAAGKIPLDVNEVPADYLSLSGHKMHAPKGIGALYISRHAPYRPWMLGGGQEGGRRSGTENVPGIIAFGKAAELAQDHLATVGTDTLAALRDSFEQHLLTALPEATIHSRNAPRLPNTTSICLPGVDAAGMLILLDQRGIACSAGSACHSAALHPSHVLEAMGFDARHAASTLRFTLSRMSTEAEVMHAAQETLQALHRLQEI